MEEKRKISVRKVLLVLLTVVVSGACIVAVVSASTIESGKILGGISIDIRNGERYHFIDKNEIMKMVITDRHIDVNNTPLNKLDMRSMEGILNTNPWVASAQVFVDNGRVLHLAVTQRVPVARIFEEGGNTYYLDATLSAMPLSPNYVYYTTVVTNVPALKGDSAGKAMKTQIVALVQKIEADTFWNAQIAQIVVDPTGNFELMPVLGNHKIVFGDTSRMQEKFSNLFLFYKNILNRIGWDKYEVLDVRYKGQVVASPSLPDNMPLDKAMATMNWVKSIIGTDPDAKNTGAAMDTAHKPAPVVVKKPVVVPLKVVKKPEAKHTAVAVKKAVVVPAKIVKKAEVKHPVASPVTVKPKIVAAAKPVKKNTAKPVAAKKPTKKIEPKAKKHQLKK